MKPKSLKTLVFILILAFYGFLLFYKIDFLTLSINDLGRHIQNGQMLLETKDVTIAPWLERVAAIGKVSTLPKREDVFEPISEQDIIEFYSR